MSIAISEQQVLYDNPCAPIVKFSYSNYLDEFDDEDVNDDPTSSNTTHDTLNSIENSFKASSLEDLVKSFDNTINTCFSDEELPTSTESIPTIENDLVITSNTWSTLIENLRTSLCNDLKLPQISKNCQITMNNVQEKKFDDDDFISIDDLNEEEEEELREQLDMHLVSISKANHHSEEFLTAEQVITDIDFMLDDLTPDSGYGDDLHLSHINDKKFYLKNQSIKSLNFLYEELNESIKNLSGVLVEELAIRDELDYEQEMKNTFISLVLNIENKRQEYQNDQRQKRRSIHRNNDDAQPEMYLTTTIPFDCNHPKYLSMEYFEHSNKILNAMNDDNAQVPELLTNYILKVLCPY